jgi:hypothetical protein
MKKAEDKSLLKVYPLKNFLGFSVVLTQEQAVIK